jgi:hypothetical protein
MITNPYKYQDFEVQVEVLGIQAVKILSSRRDFLVAERWLPQLDIEHILRKDLVMAESSKNSKY